MVVRTRRAFTLVELLVVIAIISLLIAMLLPAIQAARESGRRAVCQSNLKQFATAMQTFNTAHNSMPTYFGWFPEGTSSSTAALTGGGVYGSWYIHLMPFMEHIGHQQIVKDIQGSGKFNGLGWPTTTTSAPVLRQCSVCINDTDGSTTSTTSTPTSGTINFNGHTVPTSGSTTTCPAGYSLGSQDCWQTPSSTTGIPVGIDNTDAAGMAVAVNFCPSDPNTAVHFRWNPNSIPTQNFALVNYSANFNAFVRGRVYNNIGKPQPMSALSDGTTNTVLFGEVFRICDNRSSTYGVRLANYTNSPRHSFGIDTTSTSNRMGNTLMFQTRPVPTKCDNWRAQGMHPEGILVAFADTHVKMVRKNISRADGSNPDEPQLGGDPYATFAPTHGTWDMILLPDDGGSPSLE